MVGMKFAHQFVITMPDLGTWRIGGHSQQLIVRAGLGQGEQLFHLALKCRRIGGSRDVRLPPVFRRIGKAPDVPRRFELHSHLKKSPQSSRPAQPRHTSPKMLRGRIFLFIGDLQGQPRVRGEGISGKVLATLEAHFQSHSLFHEGLSVSIDPSDPQEHACGNACAAPFGRVICGIWSNHNLLA